MVGDREEVRRLGEVSLSVVVPGRREAPGPESMVTAGMLWHKPAK